MLSTCSAKRRQSLANSMNCALTRGSRKSLARCSHSSAFARNRSALDSREIMELPSPGPTTRGWRFLFPLLFRRIFNTRSLLATRWCGDRLEDARVPPSPSPNPEQRVRIPNVCSEPRRPTRPGGAHSCCPHPRDKPMPTAARDPADGHQPAPPRTARIRRTVGSGRASFDYEHASDACGGGDHALSGAFDRRLQIR
jgi:hypothetical protein